MAKSRDLADGAGVINIIDSGGNLNTFATTFTLPSADGTNGQVLQTNGLGTLSFMDVATYLSTNGYDTSTNIIATITDSAPLTLDTLNELAAALGDDPNFATTVSTSLGLKANSADLAAVATSGSYNDLIDTPIGGGGITTGKAIAMAMIFGG